MEMQYEVARVATHTHRGVGLGFGTFQYPRQQRCVPLYDFQSVGYLTLQGTVRRIIISCGEVIGVQSSVYMNTDGGSCKRCETCYLMVFSTNVIGAQQNVEEHGALRMCIDIGLVIVPLLYL